jgi:hypothetical protein
MVGVEGLYLPDSFSQMNNASAIAIIPHHHPFSLMGNSQCSQSGTVSELIFSVFVWENKS